MQLDLDGAGNGNSAELVAIALSAGTAWEEITLKLIVWDDDCEGSSEVYATPDLVVRNALDSDTWESVSVSELAAAIVERLGNTVEVDYMEPTRQPFHDSGQDDSTTDLSERGSAECACVEGHLSVKRVRTRSARP